jgi:hypothetical protein
LPLPASYGKILKVKGKDRQMKAILEAVKTIAEFNCGYLAKQIKAGK